jgi:hypothetical protein
VDDGCDCREGRLKPKNPTEAVAFEVLDSSGAPLWMSRDVGDLLELNRWAAGGEGVYT